MWEIDFPRQGVLYKHYKGMFVFVFSIARHAKDRKSLIVVYKEENKNVFWTRELNEWCELVEWPDGEWRQRFVQFSRENFPLLFEDQKEKTNG